MSRPPRDLRVRAELEAARPHIDSDAAAAPPAVLAHDLQFAAHPHIHLCEVVSKRRKRGGRVSLSALCRRRRSSGDLSATARVSVLTVEVQEACLAHLEEQGRSPGAQGRTHG